VAALSSCERGGKGSDPQGGQAATPQPAADDPPAMTPEEMFRQIMRGQNEVTNTVTEFKASVSQDLKTMDGKIDASTKEIKTLTDQMKQAQLDIHKLQNGDAQSAASGSTRVGSGRAKSSGYMPYWNPTYIEFKGWISRDGWKNREIKQQEAMKQNTLTDNITRLLELSSLDALHHAAFDGRKTARENTGRYWPYTRGRIYFKQGTSSDLMWQVKQCFEHEYRQGNALLPPNVRFHMESSPWKQPHVQAVGKFQGTFADVKKSVGSACRGELGPPKTFMWFMRRPEDDPDTRILIAEWGAVKGWELNEQNLRAVEPLIDQEAFLAKLNAPN